MIDTLEERFPDIRSKILHKQFITPKDIEDVTGLTEGNIFQGELSLEQLFFNRPVPGWARYRTPVQDLWMCGSATHPGGGIMGAPGRIAALEYLKEKKRGGSGGLMAKARSTCIVIGGGHNGLVAAAYLAKAGKEVVAAGARATWSAASCANSEIAPGFTAPGIAHTVGRLRAVRDQGPEARRVRPRADRRPTVRMFAPQPDGSAVTFWGDAAKTAEGAEARAARTTPRRTRRSTRRCARSRASSPTSTRSRRPTPKSPSIADAIAGLKLGKAFRDLGAKTGREAIRALPMAVADLVAEVFEDEAIRGPLATRGVLYTAMGPWAAGSAAVFLMDSAGNDGGAPGRARSPRGGTRRARRRARGKRAGRSACTIRTGADVAEIRSRDGTRASASRSPTARRSTRATGRLGRRPEAHAGALRPGGARAHHGVARRATSASRARPPR